MISVYLAVFSIILMIVGLARLRGTNLHFNLRWRIAGGVAVLLGLALIYSGGAELEKSFGMRLWTQVEGEIVEAKVIGKRAKRPQITYKYRIEEIEYEGVSDLDQPSFGGRNQRESTAKIKSSTYSPGDSVTVFVKPDNPEVSTLRPHPFWSEYAQAGFGVLLLAVGGISMLGRRKKRVK